MQGAGERTRFLLTLVIWPLTLAFLQCWDRARRVFIEQAGIACALRSGERAYYSFFCLRDVTIDHASLSRRNTVPDDVFTVWALTTVLFHMLGEGGVAMFHVREIPHPAKVVSASCSAREYRQHSGICKSERVPKKRCRDGKIHTPHGTERWGRSGSPDCSSSLPFAPSRLSSETKKVKKSSR